MTNMTIGAEAPNPNLALPHVYCPSLYGLSVALADAAFLMPRIDQNRHVREADGHGHWAASIASDPFGSNAAYFESLVSKGYKGVVNWPSSILLEGHTLEEFSTIPATPAAEYAYLAKACRAGLQTRAFFLTPEHADAAIEAGLKELVLHPGILLDVDTEGREMVLRALSSIIATIKAAHPKVTVMMYTSDWHEDLLGLSRIDCDGFLTFTGAKA